MYIEPHALKHGNNRAFAASAFNEEIINKNVNKVSQFIAISDNFVKTNAAMKARARN